LITQFDIALADASDARSISELSRDAIEQGLSWRWTARRVSRAIRDMTTNVVVARQNAHFLGFAIMKYEEEAAHLMLLAVNPQHRRRGVATALWSWLEATVRVAGIGHVQLETRTRNEAAIAFYRHHGFDHAGIQPGYYEGSEDALRMVKDMRRLPS
jgi:ribosomal-protein-alanine N-acetyltransferase